MTDQPKVLIAAKMSPDAETILRDRGVAVDVITGLDPADMFETLGAYDGLLIRSSTMVDAAALDAANGLQLIGRAGIGVDNVGVGVATARGVVVMNTSFGNVVTAAEHAIAMMMALARQIPSADRSMRDGKWEKSRFVGMELAGKTLGLVGCGNIGSIVAT